MSWRTVVVTGNSKLDLRMNYLVVKGSEIRKVHLSEISVLIIESTAVSMTSMLLCEMSRRNIKIIFCDETHNPYGELTPLYGSHDSTDKLRAQISWKEADKKAVWTEIVRNKIYNQSKVIERISAERSALLRKYADETMIGDSTNREGHAAKVYFNTLFGNGFSRRDDNVINSCLNYGYSIILSAVNRDIVSLGYNTELEIFHDNVFNHFNLGSDLMEPLRPMVDSYVVRMSPQSFDTQTKHELAAILSGTVRTEGKEHQLSNGIRIYVKSVLDLLSHESESDISFCNYEIQSNEDNSLLRSSSRND